MNEPINKPWQGNLEDRFFELLELYERTLDENKQLREKFLTQAAQIEQLQSEIPPKKQIRFVVCRDYQEFVKMKYNTFNSRSAEYRFVTTADQLRGHADLDVTFVGEWIHHAGIIDIITAVKLNAEPQGK